jgi:hypothetical protein
MRKLIAAVNRYLVVTAALGLTTMLPTVALAVPPGAVRPVRPIFVHPVFPGLSGIESRGNFKVPAHINAQAKPSAWSTEVPGTRWYQWHEPIWRSTVLWYPSLCMPTAAPWLSQSGLPASNEKSQPASYLIGSLAGHPSHSVFAMSPSDVAALASSNLSSSSNLGTTSGVSFQYALQPAFCAQ